VDLPSHVETFRRAVRRWADAVPDEVLAEGCTRGTLAERPLQDLLALRVQAASFPRRAGGLGLGQLGLAAALAELAAVDGSLAAVVMATVSCATLLYLYGTRAQRRRWLRPLLRGEGTGAIALTEPGGGSDLASTTARAEHRGRSWRLYGHKVFITNASSPLLRVVVTLARAEPEGLCCFVLPATAPGLVASPPLRPLGWTAAAVGELRLDGCRLGPGALVGTPGKGLGQVLKTLTYGRVAVAALAAGVAAGAWERALRRARERSVGGRRLLELEAIRQRLVEMQVRARVARLVALDAAGEADRGRDVRVAAAAAKWVASQAAVANAGAALQLFGADGTRPGTAVARLWGDAKVLEIVEGTTEIQRLVLARALEEAPAG
jgi:alkylation response protein AidB-like acyl-CoA dehydrogenase